MYVVFDYENKIMIMIININLILMKILTIRLIMIKFMNINFIVAIKMVI